MKKAKDDTIIQTIPKNAYESGILNKELHRNKNQDINSKTTDAQGNGYPAKNNKH